MIDKLANKHDGATIAIVGSGLTMPDYAGYEDVCIALNGGINTTKPVEYFMGMDVRLPKRDYWYYSEKKQATRIIGYKIAPNDKCMYANASDEAMEPIEALEWLKANHPIHPHCYFEYKLVEAPQMAMMPYLENGGNVAHPAIELAYRMGAKRINLYGIDLGSRGYYDGTGRGSTYGARVANFFNHQIMILEDRGIEVWTLPGPSSQVKCRKMGSMITPH